MTFEIASFSFTLYQLGLMAAVAALVGMAKTGLQGAGLIGIPVLAIVFGGKASTGVLLPVLIFADLFGVYYYHQHAALGYLKKMIPFALLGVVLGTVTGDAIDERLFNHTMVVIIFLSLSIMIWRERSADIQVPNSLWFVAVIGVVGGFTSMVGNLAGPVMALYLLAMQLPKNQLIGTAAWFFLAINLVKVPFHVFVWETITWDTFFLDIVLIPAVAVGAVLGVYVVKKIPEIGFRWFVIIATGASAVVMMV